MSGARHIAYLHEDNGFAQSPTDSTYKPFGLEPTVEDLSFERALSELGLPDDPETIETVSQQFEGAHSLSFVPAGEPWYLNHVMATTPTDGGEGSAPYTYTWTPTLTSDMPSARVYVGVDYPGGTAERELMGAIYGTMRINFAQGESPRVTLTGFHGDEKLNTSLTPGSIPDPSGTPLTTSSSTLSVPSGNGFAEIQSGTLEVQSGARFRRGLGIKPVGAASGRFSTSLDISKALLNTTQLETAYGDTAGVADPVGSEADGVLKFTTPGDTELQYDLTTVTPGEYGWENVTDLDADVLESITYTVDNLSITASVSDASAQ